MRILIEISHPAQANFFKYAALKLRDLGHEVIISVLKRGRLFEIVTKEYQGFKIIKSGIYKSNKWSIVFQANILRFFNQLFNIYKYKIDYGFSVGSFTLGAAMKIKGKPNIQFDDDPERKLSVFLERITATKVFFPPIVNQNRNIYTYNSLKEWSYLSPGYFKPDKEILLAYKIEPREYIFIREVSNKSLNYNGQASNIILTIAEQLSKYKVLFSLEDLSARGLYPKNWILLKEPLEDIHSLIYYSKCTLSSGDSMARESAMLGVPGIYCGFRQMKANDILIEKGMLLKIAPDEVSKTINDIFNGNLNFPSQDIFRESLLKDWVDVSEFIINQLKA